MFVILSTSGLEFQLSLYASEMNKTMVLVNKKPIISYILDELYSYTDFIDKIFIVGKDLKPIENFFKFDYKDESFKTKITCLKNEDSTSLISDFYSAIEYMADEMNVHGDVEVLLWRTDELSTNTRVFTDYSIGSFQAYFGTRPLNIWKFTQFPHIVNNLLYLKENHSLTMDNFIQKYSEWDTFITLNYDFEYDKLDNDYDFFVVNSKYINNDSHLHHIINVDLKDQTMEFTNKYYDTKFTRETYEKSRNIQWDLWSHYNFLEYADNEQMAYLPYPIDRSIDIRGEYCDNIKVKWIMDPSLSHTMIYETINPNLWTNIFEKVCYILKEKFIKKNKCCKCRIDDDIIEKWLKDFLKDLKCSIACVYGCCPRCNANKYNNDLYLWMELYDKLEMDLRNYINHDTLFYNGMENRYVHGNLTLENIKCNMTNGDIHFVSPYHRNREIVCTVEDYGMILRDTYAMYPLFQCGKFVDYGKNGLDVPDYIAENADTITNAIGTHIGDDLELMKEYSLFMALKNCFEEIPEENQDAYRTFLNFRVREILGVGRQ